MKDKPNEWVSISDLMAGVMAVVMLLLVMSVLQKQYADLKHKQEMEQGSVAQQKKIKAMLGELKTSVEKKGAEGLMSFDLSAGKITLKDNVFSKGSACITPEAKSAFSNVEEKVANFLMEAKAGQIFVEGHTDNIPVSHPVTDFARYCTVYDDNFTLSAARAREARKMLIGKLSMESANRIVVAGYGDSHPIQGISPESAKNRRVEVRFVIEDSIKPVK